VSAKLTPAQRRILKAAADHPRGRAALGGGATGSLIIRGFIELDGFNARGLLFKITDAGRQAVAPSAKTSNKGS
jgi:hypothetical protein